VAPGPIDDGQPELGQCFDLRPPGSLSLLRRKRLCCLFAHVTQLKLPTNMGPARSRCVGDSAEERRHPPRTSKRR